jgi:hypothetical protein
MVTAVLEVSHGVKNLWLHGASAGMKSYPNYGQYIPIDYMKAFLRGLPYMWADKKYYNVEHNMLPFDFIQPFLNEYNKLRCEVSFFYMIFVCCIMNSSQLLSPQIMNVLELMLDESMSGWQPKMSKTGSLPHISYEARTPVPLGTMLRNSVVCGMHDWHFCTS